VVEVTNPTAQIFNSSASAAFSYAFLIAFDLASDCTSELPSFNKCEQSSAAVDSGHAHTSPIGMIEGIEKASVVTDYFLGALNEAALLIAEADGRPNEPGTFRLGPTRLSYVISATDSEPGGRTPTHQIKREKVFQ
jgi:hypothetical protein